MLFILDFRKQSAFINGSPQNTFVPGCLELAEKSNVFIGGDDFKSGQTKLKSVLVDFLVSAGLKPVSIVSYNHLGNNDGKNLSAPQQFRSKEVGSLFICLQWWKIFIRMIIRFSKVGFNASVPSFCFLLFSFWTIFDGDRFRKATLSTIWSNRIRCSTNPERNPITASSLNTSLMSVGSQSQILITFIRISWSSWNSVTECHLMVNFPQHDECTAMVILNLGDSKRAMDEYTSEILMGGHNTLVIHNTCEDSLLASPIILDLVILTELCQRISFRGSNQTAYQTFHPVLSILSYLCKVFPFFLSIIIIYSYHNRVVVWFASYNRLSRAQCCVFDSLPLHLLVCWVVFNCLWNG